MIDIRATVADERGLITNQVLMLDDDPRPGDVLLRPIATGICMSDIKLTLAPDGYYPTVLGHELLALVEAVGEGVSTVGEGDLVLTTVAPICGNCRFCISGRGNLCLSGGSVVAGSQPDGTFRLADSFGTPVGQYCFLGSLAELLVTNSLQVHKIDPSFIESPVVATVSCSFSTAAGAVYARENELDGRSIAVVGGGGLGSGVVMTLASLGFRDVTVIDPDRRRLENCIRLGAASIQTAEEASTHEASYDLVFEASGFGAGLGLAARMTGRNGTCVALGMPSFGAVSELDHWGLVSEQKTLTGVVTASATPWPVYERILSGFRGGLLPLDLLIDRTYSLHEAPQALLDARDHVVAKALVVS